MTIKLPRVVDVLLEASIAGSFSRVGYETRSRLTHWTSLDSYDMSSKNVVITGPTSGLGKEVARTLRQANANVILVARSADKLNALVNELSQLSGTGTLTAVVADMGDLTAVRQACDEITKSVSSLDVLVHNAGALANAYTQTTDGIETTIASHVVGPFLMTSLLLPALRASRGRVITVSSGGMYAASLPHLRQGGSLEMSSEKFDGTRQYALAKRAQVTLNQLWAIKEPDVNFHAMHPGWADTPGVQQALPSFRKVTKVILRSPEQGADTISWLSMEPNVQGESGSFWCDRVVRSVHRVPMTKKTDTQSAREALWAWCLDTAGVSSTSS